MKKMTDTHLDTEMSMFDEILSICKNQHPVMIWWFAAVSLSLFSIYYLLLTKL